MSNSSYHIIKDPTYGYRRIDPLPDSRAADHFYETQYYHLVRNGQCAPDIKRFLEDGQEAEEEREWLYATLYADILEVLDQRVQRHPKRLLDIGCGTGEFLAFMKGHGWHTVGLELSQEALDIAANKGLEVYSLTVEELIQKHQQFMGSFDVITLINVLEHVRNPAEFVDLLKALLAKQGIIVIQVPNDFSQLQQYAQQTLKKEPWWVTPPIHLNYFDFGSLSSLLEQLGFDVFYTQADFPMELFLLMGDDYIGNQQVGSTCHQKRIRFEKSIPASFRRQLYQTFASLGIGRSCLAVGKLREATNCQ